MSSKSTARLPSPLRKAAIPAAIVLALLLRFAWPLSDPPPRFSWSNGIYTDSATMVHAARNAAHWGEWVVDYNRDLFIYPLMNFLTWLFYLPAGPGRLPGLLLSALAGTATIAGLAWGLRRTAGPSAAILGAWLGAAVHFLVMFSRIPIAENVVAALLTISAVLVLDRSTRSQVLAGGLAAGAVFFGKYHAIGFLPAIGLFVLLRERSFRRVLPFLGAATAVVAIWAATIWWPHRAEILGHVARQSTGLHGDLPFAISFLDGLGEFYNTLRRSWMLYRMPVVGVLGSFAALWIVGNRASRRRALESGSAIWAFWFVGMWVYFSLLPYKAPRYFVLAAPPLVALGATVLARMRSGEGLAPRVPARWDEHLPLVVALYSFFFGAIDGIKHYASMALEYLIIPPPRISDGAYEAIVGVFVHVDTFLQNIGWAGALTALAYVFVLWHREILGVFRVRSPRISGASLRRASTVLVVVSLAWAGWQYGWWWVHRTTFLEDVKSSLPSMVGEDAVFLGPLAPLLTQDSNIRCLPYFGPVGEPGIPEKYGVTHLVVCGEGDAAQVNSRYPGLLDRTVIVQVWPVRTLFSSTLEIRRVPPDVGGVPIHDYEPTLFEVASEAAGAEDWQGSLDAFGRYRDAGGEEIPEVLSLESVCWYKIGVYDRAENLLREAIRLRPADPLNYQNLGVLALRQGDRAKALDNFLTSLRLDPKNKDLENMIRELAR